MTLDLADDYYDIASSATYNYSKMETGKDSLPHDGVIMWHYFVQDIYFAEHGSNETTPYTVTINVKEKSNGEYVYSFNAEKESSTRQTLHADVSTRKGTNGELFLDDSITQPDDSVKRKLSISEEKSSDIRYSIDETPETPDVSENATDTNDGRTEEELTDRDMLLAMAERLVGNEKENEILTRYKEQHEAQLRREDKPDSIYDEVDEQRGILFTDPDAAKRSAAFTTNLLRRRIIGRGLCEKVKKYFRFRKIISQNLLTNPPPWCIMMPMKCMAASKRGMTAERRIELWQPRSKDPKPRWYLPRLTVRKSRRR